jgi:hypothetical protein
MTINVTNETARTWTLIDDNILLGRNNSEVIPQPIVDIRTYGMNRNMLVGRNTEACV